VAQSDDGDHVQGRGWTRRFPARDCRCRTCSPEEASRGAGPFQDAKCALLGNRATSPMSARMRAALTGPMPCRSIKLDPVASAAASSSALEAYRG
jgi:hypothetical protein